MVLRVYNEFRCMIYPYKIWMWFKCVGIVLILMRESFLIIELVNISVFADESDIETGSPTLRCLSALFFQVIY